MSEWDRWQEGADFFLIGCDNTDNSVAGSSIKVIVDSFWTWGSVSKSFPEKGTQRKRKMKVVARWSRDIQQGKSGDEKEPTKEVSNAPPHQPHPVQAALPQ